ncbi:TPR-like protein [Byssothecium circinans]|uniref:TPR-like protein n=1 Tax=Byssothecium circinans TaxID=147558 RepID=A0A6A5TFZ7_9PLEO|nr:TPR-like protein [Byssothecium circinans]
MSAMPVCGRDAIDNVVYDGEEAQKEIKGMIGELRASENEFEKWEALVLRAMELEGGVTRNSSPTSIDLVRKLFDSFLAKFPLFFGYWKKYADFEFSIGGTETAEMVYERGVSAISCSVDLWTHYCSFKLDTCHDADLVRALFERGSQYVGLDFQSHPFWDKFIEFEERVNEPANVTKLHCRAFQLIIYNYSKYFEKFRTFIQTRPIEELGDQETLDHMKKLVDADLVNVGYEVSPPEVERAIRGKLDQHYYADYVNVQTAVHERWTFENAIKRGYFHVTEVEDADLENWRKYLDFEESKGDDQRIIFLYERCLVACALYEEFWLRYARWLHSQGKDEDCRLVYVRASCIFVPISQPTVRLNWARFEEKLGQFEQSLYIHDAIIEENPNHVETMISHAGVLRRHKTIQKAIEQLQVYIDARDVQIGGVLLAEQARILWQIKGSVDEARQRFRESTTRFAESKHFWTKYLEFEANQPATDLEEAHKRVKAVHELIRKSDLSPVDSKALSHRYMEYLLDCGGEEAANEFISLDKDINGYVSPKNVDVPEAATKSSSTSKKRKSKNKSAAAGS